MIEKIINGSWAHRDILYHASISAMLKTYMYIGTGVDGFVPIKYHFVSHLIYAQFSNLLSINTLDFYSIAFPIIITPIFFMFFLHSLKEVSSFFSKINNFEPINQKSLILWILFFVFFFLPVSKSLLIEKYQYLQSQSYAMGLSLFFLIISVFFSYLNHSYKSVSKFGNSYFLPLIILILCMVCSYSKISFLLFFSLVGLYLFIRFHLYQKIYLLLLFVAWLLFNIYIYFNLIAVFDGKDLISNKINLNATNYSFKSEIFFLYVSLFYIFLKTLSLKIYSIKDLIENIKNKKIVDLEIIISLIIILYFIPYQYFKGIQIYFSYIFIISHIHLFSNLIIKK